LYEKDELVHIYEPNIEFKKRMWGKSRIDTIAGSVGLELLGIEHNQKILMHDGLDPSGVLSYNHQMSYENFEDEIERLQEAKVNGNQRGILTTIGADYIKANNTNKDMDFIELMKYTRDRILIGFGVPPSKLGIVEATNLGGGTQDGQDKTFKGKVDGRCKFIEAAWDKVLGRSGFDEVFRYGTIDLTDRKVEAEADRIKIESRVLNPNEVRIRDGLAPYDGGDEFLSNNNASLLNPESNGTEQLKSFRNNYYGKLTN
jgi:phage portal protein BeeE